MYYVEKQPCVKLHAWPQVQFVIDALCSRRRINNSFNVSDDFMWCFLLILSLSSLYAEHVSWPPGPWKLSRYDLRNPRCWSDGIALSLPCLKSVILSEKQLNSSCLIIYHYIHFFFWLPFLARWSKVSVWTVRQKSTFRFRLASLASKMHHAKVSPSLIHTSAPMGAFFIPALIFFFFCSNTCSGREGALNLSAFLFISQCTAVIRLKAKTSPNAAMPPPWAQGLESVKA